MAKILIVDDSTIVRRNLKAILTRAGHEIVAEAENGLQAYREYESHKPDLITMDITMPLMDGVVAVKKIVGDYPEAAIIMVSAIDQKSMVMAAIENGARHYIIKPFSPDKVIASIDAVLSNLPPAQPAMAAAEKSGAGFSSRPYNGDLKEAFTIENNQGTFTINIGQNFEPPKITELENTIQAFLGVKPLRMVLNFGSASIYDYFLLNEFIEIMEKIKRAGGSVRVVADDVKILRYVKNKGIATE